MLCSTIELIEKRDRARDELLLDCQLPVAGKIAIEHPTDKPRRRQSSNERQQEHKEAEAQQAPANDAVAVPVDEAMQIDQEEKQGGDVAPRMDASVPAAAPVDPATHANVEAEIKRLEQKRDHHQLSSVRKHHRWLYLSGKFGLLQSSEHVNNEFDMCTICNNAIVGAIMTACGHIFCGVCLKKWFTKKQNCPICKEHLTKNDVVALPDALARKPANMFDDEKEEKREEVVVPICSNDNKIPLAEILATPMQGAGEYGTKIETIVKFLLCIKRYECCIALNSVYQLDLNAMWFASSCHVCIVEIAHVALLSIPNIIAC